MFQTEGSSSLLHLISTTAIVSVVGGIMSALSFFAVAMVFRWYMAKRDRERSEAVNPNALPPRKKLFR